MTTEWLLFLQRELILFFLVFLRSLLLFFTFPLFAGNFFPTKLKILISLVLALSLTPFLSGKVRVPNDLVALIPLFLSDFLLFFLISLFFRFLIGGLQLGGELVGLQMGFGISQTFDPSSGVSMPILAQFLYLVFILFFLSLDLHHHLLFFLVRSFSELPPGALVKESKIFSYLLKKSGLIFDIAVKVLAPLMVFMLLVNIVLAIIGRLLPQINILFVSFPLTLGLGLFFFGLVLFLLPRIFTTNLNQFSQFLQVLLRF